MPEKTNDEFTFSVEDNEYVIKKKSNSEKKQHQKSIHGPSIVIGVSITAICVLGIFFALNGLVTDDQKLVETQISDKVFFDNSSPMLGNSNAPITLIEFGDYQCHFCNVYFHNTGHKIIDGYVLTGKVNIIFKDFTIIGPDSLSAAHATHCASEQDKYWEYHNILYNNWAGENNGWAAKENLVKYANDFKLDLESFLQCMNSNNYQDVITQSNIDAKALGISGTPAFFIIDNEYGEIRTINGAQPYEAFERVFNSILEK
jgi:protein-disulfide isomerase